LRNTQLIIFFTLLAAPSHAEELSLTPKDIAQLEAKAKQGRTDAKNILEQYNKQQAEGERGHNDVSATESTEGAVPEKGGGFGWPVACALGQNCWIVNYIDEDAALNSSKDYQCGNMTYEGHDGTDIAIRDHKALVDNVNVLAAADGKVLRVRDSEEDRAGEANALSAARDAGRECGNGVIIDHGSSWETNYCHMKKGSISVSPGQHVRKGDPLGSVGQSGLAEFPHLHFGVKHDKTVIDPFTGVAIAGCGAQGTVPMWDSDVPYELLVPYAAGFSTREPVYNQIVNDATGPERISAVAPILTFWALFYGVRAGDHIKIEILDPAGKVYVESESVQEKNKIRLMRYTGKRNANKPLSPGRYIGKATLKRTLADGRAIRRTIENSVSVER